MGPPVAESNASSTSPADRWATTPSTTQTTVATMPRATASHQTHPWAGVPAPRTTVPARTTTAVCTGTSATIHPMANENTENGSRRTGAKARTEARVATAVNARNAQITPPSNTVRRPER